MIDVPKRLEVLVYRYYYLHSSSNNISKGVRLSMNSEKKQRERSKGLFTEAVSITLTILTASIRV